MKSGFTLLEIIISIAIGSIISVVLFSSFFQINKAYKIADGIIYFDSRACIVQHQFDRDISGAFVPLVLESFEKKEKDTKSITDTKKTLETREEKETSVKIKEVPMKDGFFSSKDGEPFNFLTFITSNPLFVYGKSPVRIARVVYRLVPEKTSIKQAYGLFRQELSEYPFKFEQDSKDIGILLAENVKSLKMEYEVKIIKDKKESKNLGSKGENEPEIIYETVNSWGTEQIKKYKRNLPNFVTMKISFWDKQKERWRIFVFKSPIVAKDSKYNYLEKTTNDQEKKVQKKENNQKKLAKNKNRMRLEKREGRFVSHSGSNQNMSKRSGRSA